MNKDSKCDFTIVIPTHNRNYYLSRLINFYINQGNKINIFIVDSSNDDNADKNQSLFESLKGKTGDIDFSYNHTRNFFPADARPMVHDKVLWALENIATPYVAMCADDDFLIPSTVELCSIFLSENKDYCCARGRIFDFVTDKSKYFKLLPALQYRSIESDHASERAWLAARYYQQTFYGLFRIGTLKTVQQAMTERLVKSPTWVDELAMSTFTAALGKIKRFDEPYEYRELHDENFGHRVAKWPEMTFEEDLRPFILDYITCLKDILLKSDPQLSAEEAKRFSISTLVAFSKWYYDIRYRDSHNRPQGKASLDPRGISKMIVHQINKIENYLRSLIVNKKAISLRETRAVMNAVLLGRN